MEYCEQCERSFKSVQGLLGHNRMKHNGSTPEDSVENRPSNEPQLLEQIQWQLERIEELEKVSSLVDQMKAAAIEDHKHGMSDPECPGCITIVRESLNAAEQKGVARMVAYYEAIPRVTAQRVQWEEIKAHISSDEEREQLRAAIESDEKYLAVVAR